MRDRRKRVALIDYDARKRAFKKIGFGVFAIAAMFVVFIVKDVLFQPTPHHADVAISPSTPPASYSPSQPSTPSGPASSTLTPAQIEQLRRVIRQNLAASVAPQASAEDQRAQYVLDRR